MFDTKVIVIPKKFPKEKVHFSLYFFFFSFFWEEDLYLFSPPKF